MLVLSRKIGQKFRIGQDVTVMIVEVDRGKVRIGITAPRDVLILREEIAPEREAKP